MSTPKRSAAPGNEADGSAGQKPHEALNIRCIRKGYVMVHEHVTRSKPGARARRDLGARIVQNDEAPGRWPMDGKGEPLGGIGLDGRSRRSDQQNRVRLANALLRPVGE